jgi:hypothetical protein
MYVGRCLDISGDMVIVSLVESNEPSSDAKLDHERQYKNITVLRLNQ